MRETRSKREGNIALQQTADRSSHAPLVAHVKSSRTDRAHRLTAFFITIVLLAVCNLASRATAEEPASRMEPNVQRQLDQLERQGAVDPTTRRRLQDQLRRQPQGPQRWAAERRLERLPESAAETDRPRPEAPTSDPLPSSRRPGFGDSGGGPGTGGYMVPPGGRTGEAR